MGNSNNVGINIGVKDQATEKLKKIGLASKNMGNSFAGAYKHTQKMNKSLQSLTKDANRANASLTSFGKGMNMAIGTAKVVALANAFSRMTQLAMDAVETLNLFNVSLGENAEESEKFVANMNEAFGFDTTNIRSAVGTYALLAKSMGMSGDQAQRLAENSTKLAYDLSSLMNVPIEQVMGDLRSGLVGQSETMYKYGVDITEAALKTEALAQGISKSVRNMSQGEKMALRYSVMLKQTALAHGDFANTIQSPANQLKILGERMITLGRTIGFSFMQLVAPVLPYLNAIVSVLIDMFMVLAKLLGYDAKFSGVSNSLNSVTDDADNVSDAVDGATDSLKKMKSFSLGMDELNVIDTTNKDSASEGVGGASILPDLDITGYDNGMNSIKDKTKELVSNIKFAMNSIKDDVTSAISILWVRFAPSFKFVNDLILPELYKLKGTFFNVFSDLTTLSAPLEAWFKGDFFNLLETLIEDSGIILSGLLDTFNMVFGDIWNVTFTAISNFVTVLLPVMTDAFSKIADSVTTMFGVVKNVFDTIWSDVINPIITQIGTIIVDLFTILSDNWNEYGAVIFSKFNTAVISLGEVFTKIWETTLKPIFDKLFEVIDWLWEKHLKALLKNIVSFVSVVVESALDIINGFILPLVSNFNDIFGPTIVNVINNIINVIGTIIGVMADVFSAIVTISKGIIQFITGVLTGDWEKAWQGLANIVTGVFDGIEAVFKGIVNGILSLFESMINGIITGLNGFVTLVNKMITQANKIPGVSIGWRMDKFDSISFPKLAEGGTLSAGQLFEAGEFGKAELIGSHQGKTTVMPLENTDFVNAMYNAVKDAMDSVDLSGQVVENVVMLDGQVIYNNQQKVARNRGKNFDMGVFAR